jgi:AcrR family transcriptional regulator
MARPKKKDELNIPEKAVDAAVRLISKRQSLDFTMAEIAQEVGCSAPALYNHFTGKDELLQFVRAKVIDDARREKRARYSTDAGADAFANLREGGRRYIQFAQENPVIYRLVYGHRYSDLDSEAGSEGPNIPMDSLAELANGVRACQTRGLGFHLDPEKTAKLMWSAVHGAALLAMDEKLPGDAKARWREAYQVVDTIMNLLKEHRDTPSRG